MPERPASRPAGSPDALRDPLAVLVQLAADVVRPDAEVHPGGGLGDQCADRLQGRVRVLMDVWRTGLR